MNRPTLEVTHSSCDMPKISDILRDPKDRKRERPLLAAQWVTRHLVDPKHPWEEARDAFMKALPREARIRRPASWFKELRGTHWPDVVPPGNGPFYIPAYTWDRKSVEDAAKELGFKEVTAHVRVLPRDSEIIFRAVKVSRFHSCRFNLDPERGLMYLYPRLPKMGVPDELRNSTFDPGSLSRHRG